MGQYVLKIPEGHESALIAPGSQTILKTGVDQNRQVHAEPAFTNLFSNLVRPALSLIPLFQAT